MKQGDEQFLKEPSYQYSREPVKQLPVRNLPSEDDPNVTDEDLENAILRHCKASANLTAVS